MKNKSKPIANSTSFFAALLILTFFLWFIYRIIFSLPVFFDETIGKALFFGLPILIFVNITGNKEIAESMSSSKIKPGLLRGLAFGGLFGFVGVIFSLIMKGYLTTGGPMARVPIFILDEFWLEALLALLTSFWETLFFFVFVHQVLSQELKEVKQWRRLLMVALIFLLFHIPNSILRFGGGAVLMQLWLMFLFGLGQALLFENYRNAYTLILTQTIWGLVLLVHF